MTLGLSKASPVQITLVIIILLNSVVPVTLAVLFGIWNNHFRQDEIIAVTKVRSAHTCLQRPSSPRLTLQLLCPPQVMSIIDGINGLDTEVHPLACP